MNDGYMPDGKNRGDLLRDLDVLLRAENEAKKELDFRMGLLRKYAGTEHDIDARRRLREAQEGKRLAAHALAVWLHMYAGHLARMSMDVARSNPDGAA